MKIFIKIVIIFKQKISKQFFSKIKPLEKLQKCFKQIWNCLGFLINFHTKLMHIYRRFKIWKLFESKYSLPLKVYKKFPGTWPAIWIRLFFFIILNNKIFQVTNDVSYKFTAIGSDYRTYSELQGKINYISYLSK